MFYFSKKFALFLVCSAIQAITLFPAFSSPLFASPIVKFNGVPAEVISSSATEIQAKVPLGATTGPVIVETENSVVFSDTDFEINVRPSPYGVSARASVGNVEVSWLPPIAELLQGYNVHRSASARGPFIQIASKVEDAFYLDESPELVIGKTYYYKVSAVYSDGKESDKSLPASTVFGNITLWIPNVNGARESAAGKALSGGGAALQVPVNIENADKLIIGDTAIYIDYNAAILKPLDVEKTILSSNFEWVMSTPADGVVKISSAKAGSEPLRGLGTLFNVVFMVIDAAAEGQTAEFRFHGPTHADSPSYINSPAGEAIPLKLGDGAMQVQLAFRKGDVNGDTSIYAVDSSLALSYAMGIQEPGKGPLSGGDIDGDSVIMTNDAGLILYHIVNQMWPSLDDISVFSKNRTVDFGGKDLKNSKYLEVPVYISSLNDVNYSTFGIVFPHKLLNPVDFTLDPKLKKKFDVKAEFRKKGLAEISLLYKEKGRAETSSFQKTRIGVLKFDVSAAGESKGEISFSRINLYDRFGRDFVRSDLKMKISASKASFSVKGKGKKSIANRNRTVMKKYLSDGYSVVGIKGIEPRKGKPGDVVTITLIAEGTVEAGMVSIMTSNFNFEIDKYEYPNFPGEAPTVNVSWQDAMSLCEAAGKRLCSRDEWAAACQGSQNFTYPYGNAYKSTNCNGAGSAFGTVVPVGVMSDCASSYGAYDLSGNVYEWTGLTNSEAAYAGGDVGDSGSALSCSNIIPDADFSSSGPTIGFRCCR